MRVCLDQHYAPPQIAAALRERGHDVIAAEAEGELRGLPDEELLAFCVRERRALLSENAADFTPLVHQLAARGDEHYGLVFSSPSSIRRGAGTIGLFVDSLDRLLRECPDEGALRNPLHWLTTLSLRQALERYDAEKPVRRRRAGSVRGGAIRLPGTARTARRGARGPVAA